MRKTKLLAVAAGFLAAAGIITAGNIKVNGEVVGSYDGNVTVTGTGDLILPGNTQLDGVDGGGGSTDQCGANATPDAFSGCNCLDGWETQSGATNVDFGVDCDVQSSDDGNNDDGGNTEPPPGDCETPSGFTQDTRRTSFPKFPGTNGTQWEMEVTDKKYLAVRFTTGTQNRNGSMFFISDMHATPGFFTAAFSKCPGDFRPTNGDPNCRVSGSTLSFFWQVHNSSSQYTCDLRPGQQYYLNIAYGEGPGNSLRDTCTANTCGHLMQWDNNN